MSLVLQALSVTMTFNEPVEDEDDLAALPLIPVGPANSSMRGHSSITAIEYSDDGHTVTLTLDVGDVVIVNPNKSDEREEQDG